jgi:hypothetical protein
MYCQEDGTRSEKVPVHAEYGAALLSDSQLSKPV